MRLASFVLILALTWPNQAHAKNSAHRLTVAGLALTVVGATLTIGGVALVSYFALNPPAPDVSHGWCGNNCSSGGYVNQPLDAGAATLAVGTATLGSGIALLIVGRRQERISLVLSTGALAVHF